MRAALQVEWWKVRRAPVVLVATVLMVVLVPLLGLAMVLAAGADGVGALAAKADALLSGEGWVGYLGVVGQVAAAALFVGGGVVVAWVFGREHADGTFAALFASAIPRGAVATAKVVVVATWGLLVALGVTVVALAAGWLADVGSESWTVVAPELGRLLVVAASTTLLAIPVAWVASVGRGYLPAIGAVILVLAVSQVSVLLGGGGWFPFAVPGLVAVAGTPGVPDPGALGVGLAVLSVVGGAAATVWWWHRAEIA